MNSTKPAKQYTNTNPLEIGKGVVGGIVEEGINLLEGIGQTALDQIGFRKPATELKTGKDAQVIELTKRADSAEKKVEQLKAGFFRKANQESQVLYDRQNEIEKQKIEQLVVALKMEAESIKNQAAALTGEVKNITVSSTKLEGRKYDMNFFAWVLEMLREAKKDILKSRTWLASFNSKKRKKGYWAMFKKHGTSFAMSDER